MPGLYAVKPPLVPKSYSITDEVEYDADKLDTVPAVTPS